MLTDYVNRLRCPETGQMLSVATIAQFEQKLGGTAVPLRTNDLEKGDDRFGVTETVLMREDGKRAYPIVDEIPILLVPEQLGAEDEQTVFDLTNLKYAEAYEEMSFYNQVAGEEAADILPSEAYKIIEQIVNATDAERASFPHPRHVWLDAVYDCLAQWDAYEYIAPVAEKRVLQLGGKGAHAVKFGLAGAAESFALTPMLGEAQCARALAQAAAVDNKIDDKMVYVVAVAEELPFADDLFDGIYTGGSLHHMVTEIAVPEIVRVLKDGGRFASTDMWKAPLYSLGTGLLGKREVDVHCKPLTPERVAPLAKHFSTSDVVRHGTLTRYPLLALNKFGVKTSLKTVWTINRVDDQLCSLIPGMRGMGSSVVSMGTK